MFWNQQVDAVGPPQSLNNLVWTARDDRLCEDLDDVRKVFRVNGVVRSPLFQLLQRRSGVFEDLAIGEFDLAGCGQEGDQARNAVDELSANCARFRPVLHWR